MSMLETIKSEVLARKGDWPELCRLTGISYWWLTKFAQGRIASPGIKNLEVLQTYFEAHPREAEAGAATTPHAVPA